MAPEFGPNQVGQGTIDERAVGPGRMLGLRVRQLVDVDVDAPQA